MMVQVRDRSVMGVQVPAHTSGAASMRCVPWRNHKSPTETRVAPMKTLIDRLANDMSCAPSFICIKKLRGDAITPVSEHAMGWGKVA